MSAFPTLPPGVLAGLAAEALVAFLAFVGLLGLRLWRRGGARFGAAPAVTALALLPLAVGAVATLYAFRQVLDGLAATGSGGVAALAAGSAESLVPLLVGLALTAGLALLGFLTTALGSSRVREAAPGAGVLLPLATLVPVALAGVLVWLLTRLVAAAGAGSMDPVSVLTRWRVAMAVAAATGLLLLLLALVAALRAPRGASPLGSKLLATATLALVGLGSLAGAWATWSRTSCLTGAALTGVPCGAGAPAAAREGGTGDASGAEPPAGTPAGPASTGTIEGAVPGGAGRDAEAVEEVAATPPPPRPVRPAAGSRPPRTRTPEPEAMPGPAAVADEPEPPRRHAEPVRVGGQVRPPRKLRDVAPSYPPLARQARVQGLVILQCTIDREGRVTEVKVLRGHPLLDAAAVEAVRKWLYEPTEVDGEPVPVIMTVTVNFKLS